MPFDAHANLAYSTVAVAPAPAASGTSLTVATGQGALFPAAPFNATVWPTGVFPLTTNAEIVRVTAVVGDVLTIVRTQEGTSARTILAGDQIANTVTAKVFSDIEAAIAAGGLTNLAFSAGTLSALRSDLTFGDSNGVSFGLNTDGVITGTVRTNYQPAGAYLTTAALSQDSSKYAGTNGAITGGSITVNTAGVSVSLPAYLTTAALSQDSSKYAGTNGAITGGSITVNTAGVSVNLPAYLTTAMASNRGSDFVQAAAGFNGTNASGTIASNAISVSVAAQTVQTQNLHNVTLSGNTAGVLAAISSGTMTLAGGNNITVSQNGNAITISGANVGGAQTGISGIIASDATYTSGTVRFTGVGGGVTVSSNTGQRIDISVAAPVAQTVQTQNMVAVSLSGNTAGVLALVSSGTAFFAGGNNITLSQNGQSITISGANAGGAQTGISGVVVSDATYTSGTVSFSGQNNITIGSSVDGATQYIRLSVGNYLTTAMASNRGSDFVQAAAVFNGTNASGTIASDAISVSVAAPVPIATTVGSVASANSVGTVTRYAAEDHKHAGIGAVGISTSGNTAGTTGSVLGTYWFEGGNSITVSQVTSNNGSHTLRLSVGNYLTTAMASNRGSDFVQANAVFNGTNATGTIASNALSVSVAAPIPIGTNVKAVASVGSTGTITRYAPEDHQHAGVAAFAVTNTGNTAGNTRSQVGTFYLAASGGITASQSTGAAGNDTVWLSVAAPVAQTNQSAIKAFGVSNTGQTAGNTGVSTGIDWVLAGSNSITLSQSTAVGGPNTVWIQHPAWISTQSTQFMALTLGGNTAGTTTFHATNNASLFLNGGANITLSGNGSTITIVGAAGAGATAISGIVVSDATYTSGTVSFSNQANITIGSSVDGATQYIRLSGNPAQTVQTLGLYAVSNTTGQSSSSTFDARTLSFHGAGIASVGYSGGSVVISVPAGGGGITAVNMSAGTTSNNLSAVTFGDANGISFGIDASTITASANTVGTATTVTPVASANSVGTVTRWAAEDHRHAGIGGIGISTSGNTAGTTGSVVGTYWFEGGNNVTVSQITSNNGSHTLRLSVGAYLTTARGSTDAIGLNTAQTNVTWTVNSAGLSLNAGGYAGTVTGATGASVTANTAGVSINVPLATLSVWPDVLPGSTAVSTYYSASTSQGAGGGSTRTGYTFSLYAVPMPLPAALAFSEIRIGVSNQSVAGTGSITHMYSLGFYTNNASTLSLVTGYYGGIVLSQNSVTAQTYSVFTATTAGATSGAGGGMAGISKHSLYSSQGNISANSQIFGRLQFIRIDSGATSVLPAGQYYCVFGNATASSGANALSQVGVLQSNAIFSQHIPDLGRENSTQTSNYLPAWGAISTTFSSNSNAAQFFPLPNAIAISDMSLSSSAWQRFHFPVMRNHS
jgi:hypothetical protein